MWSNIFGARGVELTDTAALTPAVVAGLGTLFSNLAKRTCAKKLARSVGGSPAQVRPSKPPGSECCASPTATPAAKRTQLLHGVCD